jgi:O-antigen/teichoic acid export membrane protein
MVEGLVAGFVGTVWGWVFRVLLTRRVAMSNSDWRVYEQIGDSLLGCVFWLAWLDFGHPAVAIGGLLGLLIGNLAWLFRRRAHPVRREPSS